MADNKADALSKAKKQYKLKTYYSGEMPDDKTTVLIDDLPQAKRVPYLIKIEDEKGAVSQFADTVGVYHRIKYDLTAILDAVLVNAKQREAVDKIIETMLSSYLCQDMAHEGDLISDPTEY